MNLLYPCRFRYLRVTLFTRWWTKVGSYTTSSCPSTLPMDQSPLPPTARVNQTGRVSQDTWIRVHLHPTSPPHTPQPPSHPRPPTIGTAGTSWNQSHQRVKTIELAVTTIGRGTRRNQGQVHRVFRSSQHLPSPLSSLETRRTTEGAAAVLGGGAAPRWMTARRVA